MKKYVFLLGGEDLEMQEIQKILNENDIEYINKSLSWSDASWKKYKHLANEKIKEGYTVVGVELFDKDEKPKTALDIDHHNERRCEPTSIEQVAKLLDINLNSYQKLIAANDKGHIPGLIRAGASYNQIIEIRKKEYDIQRVTKNDWVKAREAIKNGEKINNVTVIRYGEEKFVPVSDLLYEKVLKDNKGDLSKVKVIPHIIHNDGKLFYSGKMTGELINTFQKEIDEGKIYYGGMPQSGYLGTVASKFSKDELKGKIEEIKDKILKLYKTGTMQTKDMYSYHIFLFPFRWKIWNKGENATMKEKFSLKEFEELLQKDSKGQRKDSDWQRNKFRLTNGTTYNEYNYFYDFVREILYDLDTGLQTSTNISNTELIQHYSYQPADITRNETPVYYNIRVNNKTYRLEVDSILLNMYATGVGVLSFHLRNRERCEENDILTINKFGRRLFPPFFGLESNSVYSGKDHTPPSEWFCGMKNVELPEKIWLTRGDNIIASEDWSNYHCPETFNHGPFTLPSFIKKLFPDNFFLTHEKLGSEKYKIYLRPALDDRMYTVSWYGNKSLIEELNKTNHAQNPNKYKYTTNDFWHNYVFIDTSKTYQNSLSLPEYLEKHTYSRWIDYGTLYGMSRYSLVMLTSSYEDLVKYNAAFLIRHLQTMYYKMAELSILQRATIINFSDEVTHVSDLVHGNEEKALDRIEELYKHYILFVNKIYFREITAQEQGIEMYDLMQHTMRIPEQVKDLDNEIAELNSFAGMIADKNEKEEMRKHTRLATIFLPPMFITAYLGMNYFEHKNDINWDTIFKTPLYWILALPLLIITLIYAYNKWLENRKLLVPIITLIFWIMMIIVFICNKSFC